MLKIHEDANYTYMYDLHTGCKSKHENRVQDLRFRLFYKLLIRIQSYQMSIKLLATNI